VYRETAPFTVPAATLVPRGAVNLLAAGKNLGATQVAAAAYRVHHGEWAVGEAAGALAARCAHDRRPVTDAHTDAAFLLAVQRDLVAAGVPLAWVADVPADDPRFAAVHLAAAYGALEGERAATLAVHPDRPAGPADADAARRAARALGGDPSAVDTHRAFGAVLEDITR
jgi:hypothetical protein